MESNDYVLLRPSAWRVMTLYAGGLTPKQISLELGQSLSAGELTDLGAPDGIFVYRTLRALALGPWEELRPELVQRGLFLSA
jgi:hypothetical protein